MGSFAAMVQTALSGPSGGRAAQAAFGSALLSTAPLTAGAGALYTIGSCLAEDLLGSRDWRSSGFGGMLAGAVTIGLKQRSAQGAFVGAIAMGFGCSAVTLASLLEPTAREIQRVHAPAAVAITSEELASTSAASRAYTSRLQ